jgi:ribosome maturation factor RimP
MRRQDKWHAVLDTVFEGTPFELVGVETSSGGKRTIVRIFIDKPGGINIDEITSLTRAISAILDVQEIIHGGYTLEVSSPGLDRPLFLPRHFQQQVGQKIALKSHVPIGDRQNFRGLLQKADDKGVQMDVDGQEYIFPYTDIEKARVIPDIKIK